MSHILRIFISSSGLSTLYLSINARQTARDEHVDIFFIDALSMKSSQKELIFQAASHHHYDEIFDMSIPLEEGASHIPNRRKQLTRRLKTRTGFKQLYHLLYKYKLREEDRTHIQTLQGKAGDYLDRDYQQIEIHTQPVLQLNRAFKRLFPSARMHYFEHGLGDYLDVDSKLVDGDTFHCVFAHELKDYYSQTGRKTAFISPLLSSEGFLHPDLPMLELFSQLQRIDIPKDKYIALIAVQPLEQFQVDPAYWDHFLSLCLEKIEDLEDVLFLVKPHPRQDQEIVRRISEFLLQRGIDVVLWDQPSLRSLNMEILFHVIANRVRYVFSPFSSSVFYLSQLYQSSHIKYYYSLQSIFPYTTHTPELYIQRWNSLHPYLQEVFGKHAEEM